MKNKTCIVVATWLALAAPAAAALVEGGARPTSVFSPVSVERAGILKSLLATPEVTAGQSPSLVSQLAQIDLENPSAASQHASLLGPLNLALANLDAAGQSRTLLFAEARRLLRAQEKASVAQAAAKDATVEQLAGAVSELGRLFPLIHQYDSYPGDLANEWSRAKTRLDKAQQEHLEAVMNKTAEELGAARNDDAPIYTQPQLGKPVWHPRVGGLAPPRSVGVSSLAIKRLIPIMRGMSSAIVRIAEEDDSIQSTINTEEIEHAMKNAFEDMLGAVIDSSGFDSLDEDEKWARFEKVYLDAAVDSLSYKGMSKDSKDNIREVLRHQYVRDHMNQLRDWIKDEDVWLKWHNPKREAKDDRDYVAYARVNAEIARRDGTLERSALGPLLRKVRNVGWLNKLRRFLPSPAAWAEFIAAVVVGAAAQALHLLDSRAGIIVTIPLLSFVAVMARRFTAEVITLKPDPGLGFLKTLLALALGWWAGIAAAAAMGGLHL